MDVPDRVRQLLVRRLVWIGAQLLMVFVDRLGDDIEIHPLGGFGFLIHEIGQAFGGRIGQPFVDAEAVALGFRDLLAVLIQEQLIGKMLGLASAQNLADAVIDRRVGAVVLAIHFKVHIQRRPAGAEVGLPLQLHMATGDRQGQFLPVLVVKGDGAVFRIDMLDRNIQHLAGLGADWQEAGIALLTLFAQAGQHDLHDRVIAFCGQQQRRVELAGFVELGRADEFIFKAERVEEPAQHGVVVAAKAVIFAERVRHRGQRFLQMLAQHLLLGDVFRHLAHSVHVVRETEEPRRNVRDHLEGAADHCRARHLAEGADMGQTRGTIAGLEEHVALFRVLLLIAFQHAAGLFKGPSLGFHRGVTQSGHLGVSIHSNFPRIETPPNGQ